MPDKPLILMIDDDEFAIATLQALLQSENYHFLVAENGQTGLEKAKQYHPDLILLDIMMPDMDGFTLCQQIRQDKEIAELTIVMITALDDKESKIKGFEAGADDYITKPFDKVELKLRVQTILKLNRFRKLSMERDRFKSVFDDFPRAIFLIDQEGIIKEINHKANEIFHCSPLVGFEFTNLLHPTFRDHFLQTLDTLTQTHNRTNLSVLFALSDQEVFPTDVFLLRLVIQDKVFYQVLIKNEATNPFSEIADRSTIQFFQEMANPLCLVNTDYQLLWANPSMMAFLGYATCEEAKNALQEWFCLDKQRAVNDTHPDFSIRLVPFAPAKQSLYPNQECLFHAIHMMIPGKNVILLAISPTGEQYHLERWESQIYTSLAGYLSHTRTRMDTLIKSMMGMAPTGQLFKNYWEAYNTTVSPLITFLYLITRYSDKSLQLPVYTPEPTSLYDLVIELDEEISHDPEWSHPALSLNLKPTPLVLTDKKIVQSIIRAWLYFIPPGLVHHTLTLASHQTETLSCLDIHFDPTPRKNPNWEHFWTQLFYRKPPRMAHPEDAYYLLRFKKLISHLGGTMQFHHQANPPLQHITFCFPIYRNIEK